MNEFRQTDASDVLNYLLRAEKVFVRLVLSNKEQGVWLARGLIVDVLPQQWLNYPDVQENITGPWWKPTYCFISDRAIFLRGFLSGRKVYDWLTSQPGRALTDFDTRTGHRSHSAPFTLPALHDTVQENLLPSYGGWYELIGYPQTLYAFQPKAYQPPNQEQGALIGWDTIVGEGRRYRDYRAAFAELILGVRDPRGVSDVQDRYVVRVVHGEGWIQDIQVLRDKVAVTLGGTAIEGTFVGLDVSPEKDVREQVNSPHVKLPLPDHLPQYFHVVLFNSNGELDQATISSASSPAPRNSPQVRVVERADVYGYTGKPSQDEPTPAPTAPTQEGDETSATPTPSGEIIPMDVVEGAPSYIRKVVEQINRTYNCPCYDACAVMIRRLIETLIIEAFEANKIADHIKKNGRYLQLQGLVDKILVEKDWDPTRDVSLTRNTEDALRAIKDSRIKDAGDLSAHTRHYNAVRGDIDKIALDVRVATERLLYLAKLKK